MKKIFELDVTLGHPEENLALDEALLEGVDSGGLSPVLRFWESPDPFVVLGLGCRLEDDVNLDSCRQDGVPVLRRASGGGTVLQGPGSLSYALVLPMDFAPELASITATNEFVIQRMADAFRDTLPHAGFRGISDLAVGDKKVSGNAQRRKKHAILFHGTFLYGMSSETVSRYLRMPNRKPDYRAERDHGSFLTNLPFTDEQIRARVKRAWNVTRPLVAWPKDRLQHFVHEVRRRS